MGDFVGFTQNLIDSSLLVSYWNTDFNEPKYNLAHINSRTGIINKKTTNDCVFWQTYYLNDTISIITRNPDVKIQNKNNLDILFSDKIDAYDLFYNKYIDRAISSSDSKIKIYDTKEYKIIKEYNSSNYFNLPNVQVRKVAITSYKNYIIYSSETQLSSSPPYPRISQLVVLDSNGNELYKDEKAITNQTPGRVLAISNNQKLIAYYTDEKLFKILDLTTLKVVKSVSILNLRPLLLRFSPDDKLLFLGSESGLMYFDLENWKIKWLTKDGSIGNFNFDLFNPNIIYNNLGGLLQAFKINSLTSVINENPVPNTFVANYQVNTHSLNLNMNLVNNGNLMITLYNISGSPLMVLENSLFQLGESSKNYNISTLPQGAYYLQIKLNNEIIYPALNFIKVN